MNCNSDTHPMRLSLAGPPLELERILVVKRCFAILILDGNKDMEIRHQCLRRGRWLLGTSHMVLGCIYIGVGAKIEDDANWRDLWPKHHWRRDSRPYKNTWALPILRMHKYKIPFPYERLRGSIGTSLYRPSEQKEVARTNTQVSCAQSAIFRRPSMDNEDNKQNSKPKRQRI